MKTVDFDLAVRLDKLGYDGSYSDLWVDDGSKYKLACDWIMYILDYEPKGYPAYRRPYLEEVAEWLRDKHNIHICVIGNYRCDGSLCGFELWIQGLPQGRKALYYETDSLSEYDMALETAINKVLHLIEKE